MNAKRSDDGRTLPVPVPVVNPTDQLVPAWMLLAGFDPAHAQKHSVWASPVGSLVRQFGVPPAHAPGVTDAEA